MQEPSVDITRARSHEYYRLASVIGETMQDLHLDSDMENPVITAKEVADILHCSKSKAYGLIKRLNIELQQKGKITLHGATSRKYFKERLYLA
jgi:hypothetical protein